MNKPEYRALRCCMCPNVQENKTICPGIPGTFHPQDSPCRFVKSYINGKDELCKVVGGFGENRYKARRFPIGKAPSGKDIITLLWRKTFDDAQVDLNDLARRKNWREADTEKGD